MRTKSLIKTMTLAVCGVAAFAFASCDKNNDKPKVGQLKFNPSTVEVAAGATASVTVTGGVAPYNAVPIDGKTATVKVDKNVLTITGVKAGTTGITVADKNRLSGRFTVKVKDAANALQLDKTMLSLGVGKDETVTVKNGAAPFMAAAADKTVAEVTVKDNKVTVKGLKAGSTTVTISDKDKKVGTIQVTIK